MSARRALLALLLFGSTFPSPAGAQDEPTPFWMPTETAPAPKKKKEKPKRAPPEPEGGSSVYVAPSPDDAPPARRKGQKPPKPPKPGPKPRKTEAPPPLQKDEPAPRPRKHEPLPAFPHLDPDEPKKPVAEPTLSRPAGDAEPARPLPAPESAPEPPARPPALRPKKEVFDPDDQTVRSAPKPTDKAPPPAPLPRAREPAPEPARGRTLPSLPAVEPERPIAAPLVPESPRPPPSSIHLQHERAPEAREASEAPASPDEYVPVPLRWRRSLTLLALGGAWQKPQGTGRSFEPGYGLQVAWAFGPWLQIDLTALRAGSTKGSGFASTSLTHNLLAARLWATWNLGAFSVMGGAGFGGVLSQTLYSLQDVGQPESTLPATALKMVVTSGVGARARPWRGLEVRLEVNTLLRDGRIEPVLIAGLGWAF